MKLEELYPCNTCASATEYMCCRCEEPICENCARKHTYLNPCEETRCDDCSNTFDDEDSVKVEIFYDSLPLYLQIGYKIRERLTKNITNFLNDKKIPYEK